MDPLGHFSWEPETISDNSLRWLTDCCHQTIADEIELTKTGPKTCLWKIHLESFVKRVFSEAISHLNTCQIFAFNSDCFIAAFHRRCATISHRTGHLEVPNNIYSGKSHSGVKQLNNTTFYLHP